MKFFSKSGAVVSCFYQEKSREFIINNTMHLKEKNFFFLLKKIGKSKKSGERRKD